MRFDERRQDCGNGQPADLADNVSQEEDAHAIGKRTRGGATRSVSPLVQLFDKVGSSTAILGFILLGE
jgi:hypothetical protein